MRPIRNLNDNWTFTKRDGRELTVNLPHTWNAFDGTNGANDYYRGMCIYKKNIGELRKDKDEIFILEFQGVNSSCDVYMNDFLLGHHDGGYSTFRFLLDDILLRRGENILKVEVDNSPKNNIYPRDPDYTVYGGIYRDVNLITTNKNHFDILQYAALGVDISVYVNNRLGVVEAKPFIEGKGNIQLTLFNDRFEQVAKASGERVELINPHLWNGREDPYLYTLQIDFLFNGKIIDQISKQIGFRSFRIDPKKGFYLNEKLLPLRGVSKSQDREGLGNAISKLNMEEDITQILELGANSVRLSNCQHDDYFLELCDKNGLIVFAEIPYTKEYLDRGNENALNQMKELMYQQKHHPSIFFWNLGNDVERTKDNCADVDDLYKILNSLCKAKDPYRKTMIGTNISFNSKNTNNKIADSCCFNFNLGQLRPLFTLSHTVLDAYHLMNPTLPIALNNKGEEGVINRHGNFNIKSNNTEEYQLLYHAHILKFLSKKPWIFAAHVSNMYDYGNDKNEGPKPGIETTGLITFDHKIKKDAFYIYKAYWSNEPFVYIAGKRFENRNGPVTILRIITNEPSVDLYINDRRYKTLSGKKLYSLYVPLKDTLKVQVKGNSSEDSFTFNKVKKFDENYKK